MIKLIEETHKYINTETGEEYTSVSAVLSQFKKPFDTKYWAAKKAKDYGTTAEEVMDKWDKINDFSCHRGKNYHKIMEDFIIEYKETPGNSNLYSSFTHNLNLLGDANVIYAEKIVYNHEFKVAGMADVIVDHGSEFSIMDLKTNKQFRYLSKYNEYLLKPVDHLQSCEFNNYALQLSLYAFMYSQMTGKKLRALAINYLNTETERWRNIPIQYLRYEAYLLLKSKK